MSTDNKTLDERIADFNSELEPLLAKHELKLSAEPMIINGLIFARPVAIEGMAPVAETVEESAEDVAPVAETVTPVAEDVTVEGGPVAI